MDPAESVEDREEYILENRGRHPSYRFSDWRHFPITPLARLLKKESNRIVKERMKELESIVRKKLSRKDYKFLTKLVGRNWGEELSLPSLEFVDDIKGYVDKIIPDLRARVHILRDTILKGVKKRERALYFASIPYFLTTDKEAIEVYLGVLSNSHKFPQGFFERDEGRKAGAVTRYMYGNLIRYKPEEVFERARKSDFTGHALGPMLKSQFNDSLINAVQNAYPKSSYPQLYNQNGNGEAVSKPKGLGVLSDLVDSLDDLFKQPQ